MRFLLPILFLLYCTPAFSQYASEVDSVYQYTRPVTDEDEQQLKDLLKKNTNKAYTSALYAKVAEHYYDNKMYDKAAFAFNDILNRYPDYKEIVSARYHLGVIAIAKKDTAKGVQILESFVADTSLNRKFYDTTRLGALLRGVGHYKHFAVITLVHVFNRKKDHKNVIKYMELEDDVYAFPGRTCGFGMDLEIKEELDEYYYHFMKLKDTVGAMKRFLKYVKYSGCKDQIMRVDIRRLHEVLGMLYTPEEIAKEVKRSASNISLGFRDEEFNLISYNTTLFGEQVYLGMVTTVEQHTQKPKMSSAMLDDAYRKYSCTRFYKRYVKD